MKSTGIICASSCNPVYNETSVFFKCNFILTTIGHILVIDWYLFKIMHYLEVLQKIFAGDLVASDLFLYQLIWRQKKRHELGQLFFELFIDV